MDTSRAFRSLVLGGIGVESEKKTGRGGERGNLLGKRRSETAVHQAAAFFFEVCSQRSLSEYGPIVFRGHKLPHRAAGGLLFFEDGGWWRCRTRLASNALAQFTRRWGHSIDHGLCRRGHRSNIDEGREKTTPSVSASLVFRVRT